MSKEETPSVKITFGPPPATFVKEVRSTLLNGAQLKFNMTFKHRTREQYGALMDDVLKRSNEPLGEGATVEAVFGEKVKGDAQAVLDMAESWSLQDPFTIEHLNFVAANYPGVIFDISETYRAAIVEGRTKN